MKSFARVYYGVSWRNKDPSLVVPSALTASSTSAVLSRSVKQMARPANGILFWMTWARMMTCGIGTKNSSGDRNFRKAVRFFMRFAVAIQLVSAMVSLGALDPWMLAFDQC